MYWAADRLAGVDAMMASRAGIGQRADGVDCTLSLQRGRRAGLGSMEGREKDGKRDQGGR